MPQRPFQSRVPNRRAVAVLAAAAGVTGLVIWLPLEHAATIVGLLSSAVTSVTRWADGDNHGQSRRGADDR